MYLAITAFGGMIIAVYLAMAIDQLRRRIEALEQGNKHND